MHSQPGESEGGGARTSSVTAAAPGAITQPSEGGTEAAYALVTCVSARSRERSVTCGSDMMVLRMLATVTTVTTEATVATVATVTRTYLIQIAAVLRNLDEPHVGLPPAAPPLATRNLDNVARDPQPALGVDGRATTANDPLETRVCPVHLLHSGVLHDERVLPHALDGSRLKARGGWRTEEAHG